MNSNTNSNTNNRGRRRQAMRGQQRGNRHAGSGRPGERGGDHAAAADSNMAPTTAIFAFNPGASEFSPQESATTEMQSPPSSSFPSPSSPLKRTYSYHSPILDAQQKIQAYSTVAPEDPVPGCRARPSKWTLLCRYVTEKQCPFKGNCFYGHEGDKYTDAPHVVQQFEDGINTEAPKGVSKAALHVIGLQQWDSENLAEIDAQKRKDEEEEKKAEEKEAAVNERRAFWNPHYRGDEQAEQKREQKELAPQQELQPPLASYQQQGQQQYVGQDQFQHNNSAQQSYQQVGGWTPYSQLNQDQQGGYYPQELQLTQDLDQYGQGQYVGQYQNPQDVVPAGYQHAQQNWNPSAHGQQGYMNVPQQSEYHPQLYPQQPLPYQQQQQPHPLLDPSGYHGHARSHSRSHSGYGSYQWQGLVQQSQAHYDRQQYQANEYPQRGNYRNPQNRNSQRRWI